MCIIHVVDYTFFNMKGPLVVIQKYEKVHIKIENGDKRWLLYIRVLYDNGISGWGGSQEIRDNGIDWLVSLFVRTQKKTHIFDQ